MDNFESVLKLLLEAVNSNEKKTVVQGSSSEIPVGISNRHIHLSQKDLECLFGKDYQLTKIKDLSQPGQYACKEVVTLCGAKGAIEKVRILGPVRSKTQVEVLAGDCIKLGAAANVRLSGDLNGTPSITVVGPKGSVQIEEGLVVAQRHIHMTPEDAKNLGVCDGEVVSIKVDGLRGGVYSNVAVRANDASSLECHLDIEEANAMSINSKSKITIVK
ncbi:phosphate propanoyltransferase [Clostridium sp. P21]|uniref:Phosphate propanoyltransferase n=1 Tax=Clostridium muellerianum TaxID=2716538 RepID=A0A7Y0EKY3_9CLOT|nr:phosphate propanoyltransferase [Clostridium muellerianum]NMM65366.1 phosphate propanoyltransferase [Clostridium muellerianum]